MNDADDVYTFGCIAVAALGFVIALALLAWVLFCADWFEVDFTESAIEDEVDARLLEEQS